MGVPIDINAGIHDGHTGSVPISHSLYAFNILAEVNGFKEKIISKELIKSFTEDEMIPQGLKDEYVDDAIYKGKVLFRREAGQVRITIFDGGHDIYHKAGFEWLSSKKKKDT